MIKEENIASDLLKEMFKKRIISNSYKPIEKIARFFPSHIRGNVKKVIRQLVSRGILLSFKSGKCISINSKRLQEISEIIGKNL